jgi:hypothetical protein
LLAEHLPLTRDCAWKTVRAQPVGATPPGHGGRPLYRANEADQQAWQSASRPKSCRLATHRELQEIVASKLMQDWSPEQISGWLKQSYPDDESLRVHRPIETTPFLRAYGVSVEELAVPDYFDER